MLSSRSQLNQDIIQNAQGELTCWPTFDKLRGTGDSFFIHSFLFKSPQQFQMKPNASCWRTQARKIFINTANKKSRVRRYFSLVLRSLNWACHPAVHPTSGLKIEEEEKNSLHHASFTYVLTAITSPMMHFCVERRHQVIRRNLHVHQLWQTSRRAYNHISSHCQTYLLKKLYKSSSGMLWCFYFL